MFLLLLCLKLVWSFSESTHLCLIYICAEHIFHVQVSK